MMSIQLATPDIAVKSRTQVLVIDDDPLFRGLLVAVLRGHHEVLVATDGAEGYRRAVEHRPDLIVIDIQMPGWDGLKVLSAIRGNPDLSQTGAVILTSDASRETVLAAIRAGADEYVIKTHFSREGFLRKLDRLKTHIASRRAAAEPSHSSPPIGGSVRAPMALTATQSRRSASTNSEAEFSAQLQELIDAWD